MHRLSALSVALVAALALAPTPTVAPFPPTDPRSIFNYFVLPWWYHAPYKVRNFVHTLFTGEPLPKFLTAVPPKHYKVKRINAISCIALTQTH
jgi:hypothetical protein